MASTKRIDSYGRSMMIKIIHDVMKSDWPEEFKKHLLLRELLWKSDSPKGVKGTSLYTSPDCGPAGVKTRLHSMT